jgi:hypothetical protein
MIKLTWFEIGNFCFYNTFWHFGSNMIFVKDIQKHNLIFWFYEMYLIFGEKVSWKFLQLSINIKGNVCGYFVEA